MTGVATNTRWRAASSIRFGFWRKRLAEDWLAWKEHDHEVGSFVELLPVGLGAQLRDVIGDLPSVLSHVGVLLVGIVGLERVEICSEWESSRR